MCINFLEFCDGKSLGKLNMTTLQLALAQWSGSTNDNLVRSNKISINVYFQFYMAITITKKFGCLMFLTYISYFPESYHINFKTTQP